MDAETKEMLNRILEKLEEHDQRFAGIDQRFEGIDQQFAGINQRFEGINQRFEGINQQFTGISQQFEGIGRHFKKMDQDLLEIKSEQRITNARLEKIEVCLEYALEKVDEHDEALKAM